MTPNREGQASQANELLGWEPKIKLREGLPIMEEDLSCYKVFKNAHTIMTTVPVETLKKIIIKAHRLVDLGTGSFIHDPKSETYQKLKNAMSKSTCKELEELGVFPSDPVGPGNAAVIEEGLVAISVGCHKLHSLLYFCQQMTNAALITTAKNCPNFIRFRLCILDPAKPNPDTMQRSALTFTELILLSAKDLPWKWVRGLWQLIRWRQQLLCLNLGMRK